MSKRIAILGSTGSIGTQALEVVDAHSGQFEVEVLTANNNVDLLIEQAKKYHPNTIVIGNEEKYQQLSDALKDTDVKVYAGDNAIAQVVQISTIDVVLTAMVGFSGLLPTINAIKAGKQIALANKETLVVAGDIITKLALENKVSILPVDSEHSAIFQCLAGEFHNPIEKIILTASGGPFRGKKLDFLRKVTRCQALNHPNWSMGDKITIDSASMMNKGLEAIEARWLFNVKPDDIEVVVHPQSIVHSLVQFEDGSIKAQLGLPDMRLPIQYAMTFPERYKSDFPRFNFMDYPELTFEKVDVKVFKNLDLAYQAMHKGGNMPCILNAANEVAVDGFLKQRIGFVEMSDVIEKTMMKASLVNQPSLDDYIQSNAEARAIAEEIINGR
ncbi:1-deoxy-D-xylulose-5-phosphate reductoisomerase [Carboxylicivirga sediminis]|uniref:1-deoxy-D-xylulose 5-phosphate reductoisomerase n=1 Tax=Carboxylicivirga sediminis TaxID=2006564 RepID=A0A941EZB3_9BACT|nr:1-deoxy-D-xylulose-5-phosphate reductoisomerase [Carboxylicivirga sediminis]MBR8534336.1 1-deoxy-D-xylulose-5-phosphate reductoisomerase [Carboxylicivirga sediminis]